MVWFKIKPAWNVSSPSISPINPQASLSPGLCLSPYPALRLRGECWCYFTCTPCAAAELWKEPWSRQQEARAAPAASRGEGSRKHNSAKAPKMPVLVANSSLVGVLYGCRNTGSTQTECLPLATEKGVGALFLSDPNSGSEPHPF